MRKVVACAICRSRKIKCKHEGVPPCMNCRGKSYEGSCVLRLPHFKRAPKLLVPDAGAKVDAKCSTPMNNLDLMTSENEKLPSSKWNILHVNGHNREDLNSVGTCISPLGSRYDEEGRRYRVSRGGASPSRLVAVSDTDREHTPLKKASLLTNSLPTNQHEYNDLSESSMKIADILVDIPESALRFAVEQIVASFPELAFLHKPIILHKIKDVDSLIMGAILELFTSFNLHERNGLYGEWLGPQSPYVKKKVYGKLVVEEIVSPIYLTTRPSIDVVQALLILTLSYWGKGEYFMCWMLHGNAVRMLQSFGFCRFTSDNDLESDTYVTEWTKSNLNEFDSEILNRTYWSCFIVDRIAAFGKNRSFSFSRKDYENVPLPQDTRSFALMMTPSEHDSANVPEVVTTKTYDSFFKQYSLDSKIREHAILIKVYSLWGEISQFLIRGGRRNESVFPWHSDSVVYILRHGLRQWWELLPLHWQWAKERFTLHQTLGTDTMFTMCNCIYHLCVIYINREYLPFLPHSAAAPCGPTEPPILPTPTETDYWTSSADECFQSVRSLSYILSTLLDMDLEEDLQGSRSLYTRNPFYCFCAFTAAIQGMYGSKFSWMDTKHERHLNSSLNLANCSLRMFMFLEVKQVYVTVAQKWYNIANRVMDLYDFVAKNRDKAREMNLGRNNLVRLEGLIQLVNAGISPYSVNEQDTMVVPSPSREDGDGTNAERRFTMDDLQYFITEDMNFGEHIFL